MQGQTKVVIALYSLILGLLYFQVCQGATLTYTYDNLNRLTKVVYGDGTIEEFTYDAAGNRLTHIVVLPPTAFDTVQKIFIGYYQRPADPGGLLYWADRLYRSGGNLSEIIEAFANSAESQELYGTINSSNISTVVKGIYNALFGRNAEAEGLNFYVNGFNSGQFTAATIMLNVLFGAQNEDLQSVNNKVTAANLLTRTIDPELDGRDFQATYAGDTDAQKARLFLSTVGWDPATIPTQTQVTLFIKNNIADPGDPILAQTPPSAPSNLSGATSPYTQVSTTPTVDGGGLQLIGLYPQSSDHYGANIFVLGNYAYFCENHVSWTDTYVRILDVTTPSSPSLAGSYFVGGLISAIHVVNGYIYLGLNNILNEFQTVNVTNPAAPSLAATNTNLVPYDIMISGNYLYAVGDYWGDYIFSDFNSFSLSNPAAPLRVGSYYQLDSSGENVFADSLKLALQGNYAYIAASDRGLVVLDISNPAAPTYAGGYNSPIFRGYETVSVSGNYACVMNLEGDDIEILNISNPSSITSVGKYEPPGFASDFVLRGHYLYVAEGTNGLKIVDISNPSSPVVAATYKPTGVDPNSIAVFVSGQDVYVADAQYGLMIIRFTP